MLYLRFAGAAGAVLLALMLIANAFMPTDATPAQEQQASNMPKIRITADRKGPELVQIDTSLPTMSPPPQAFTAPAPLPPPVREARAEVPADQAVAAKVADAKPEAKPHKATHRRTYAQQLPPRGYPYYPPQQQPMMPPRPQFAGLFGGWFR